MRAATVLLFAFSVPAMAADASNREVLDLDTISRIRSEGFFHSRVMELAAGLADGIGGRLTASPEFTKAEQWAQSHLKGMGAANVHSESWGEFGMGWQQIGTSLQMTEPALATFVAHATPWSPATAGDVTAEIVAVPDLHDEKDLEAWKGKLAGKIVLYGDAPTETTSPLNPAEHYDAAQLEHFRSFPLDLDQKDSYVPPADPDLWVKTFKNKAFLEKVANFFAAEKAVAALRAGGANGVLQDDLFGAFGWWVYRPDRRQTIPSAVIDNEAFGRILRLTSHQVPVSVRLNIATRFTGEDHVPGKSVIADIPGTDPRLENQIVMFGAHLDSWFAGAGAEDNGAGVVIAMEAVRILKQIGAKPRRTIRVALWGGEEQGILGSNGYVSSHIAERTYSTDPDQLEVVECFRRQTGAPVLKSGHATLDAYFNIDNGAGKLLGIFTEGNLPAANIFQQWMAPIQDLGFSVVTLRNSGTTDHVPFDEVGIPAFQFLQDPRDSHSGHTNFDTYERLQEPDLKQAAVILAIFAYNTAQRDAMLPRKPLPNPGTSAERAKPLDGNYPGRP